jgi:hypothetical protein
MRLLADLRFSLPKAAARTTVGNMSVLAPTAPRNWRRVALRVAFEDDFWLIR